MPVQRLHPLHGHFYLYSVHTAYLSKRLLMRVLVIGSNGRMGKLYAAIVRYLGHEVVPHDTDTGPIPNRAKYEKAIIATPIDTHHEYCKWLAERKCDFLCEKPISKNIDEVCEIAGMCEADGVNGFMVSNWAFAIGASGNSVDGIKIHTYNTGNDGDWDLIQPLWLLKDSSSLEVTKTYPGVRVERYHGEYTRFFAGFDFERSYIEMVEVFICGEYSKLWTIKSVIPAHERVVEYGKRIATA